VSQIVTNHYGFQLGGETRCLFIGTPAASVVKKCRLDRRLQLSDEQLKIFDIRNYRYSIFLNFAPKFA